MNQLWDYWVYKIENAEMIEEDENEETVYINEELDDIDKKIWWN